MESQIQRRSLCPGPGPWPIKTAVVRSPSVQTRPRGPTLPFWGPPLRPRRDRPALPLQPTHPARPLRRMCTRARPAILAAPFALPADEAVSGIKRKGSSSSRWVGALKTFPNEPFSWPGSQNGARGSHGPVRRALCASICFVPAHKGTRRDTGRRRARALESGALAADPAAAEGWISPH